MANQNLAIHRSWSHQVECFKVLKSGPRFITALPFLILSHSLFRSMLSLTRLQHVTLLCRLVTRPRHFAFWDAFVHSLDCLSNITRHEQNLISDENAAFQLNVIELLWYRTSMAKESTNYSLITKGCRSSIYYT